LLRPRASRAQRAAGAQVFDVADTIDFRASRSLAGETPAVPANYLILLRALNESLLEHRISIGIIACVLGLDCAGYRELDQQWNEMMLSKVTWTSPATVAARQMGAFITTLTISIGYPSLDEAARWK